MLSGQCLQFIDEFKYLGNILNNSCADDNDIKREIRNLYARMCLKSRFRKYHAMTCYAILAYS